MYKSFACHNCGSALEVEEDVGRWVQCPHCQANTDVPADARRVLKPTEPTGDHHEKARPGPVEVRGRPLVCPVCDGDRFWTRRTLLNTALATFFNVEFMNKAALNQVCTECGYIFWFFED